MFAIAFPHHPFRQKMEHGGQVCSHPLRVPKGQEGDMQTQEYSKIIVRGGEKVMVRRPTN